MKNFATLFAFFLSALPLLTQTAENCPGIEWERSYGGTLDERIGHAIPTRDSGFILSGSSRSSDVHLTENKGGADAAMIKINAAGEVLWSKTYGGPGDDEIRAMAPAVNEGYFFCGQSGEAGGDISSNAGALDAWVGKVDEEGSLAWQYSFGTPQNDFAHSLQPTEDGGCLVVAVISSSQPLQLSRFSASGELVWSGNYNHIWRFSPLEKSKDGNFYLSTGDFIVKMNPDGLFIDSIPLPSPFFPISIEEKQDGQAVLVGLTVLNPSVKAMRIDGAGQAIWEQRFNLGEFQEPIDVLHEKSGQIQILSRLQNSGPPETSEDYCLSQLDSTGQVLQHRIFGGTLGDAPRSLLPTIDGGLLLSGESQSADGDISSPIGAWDFWVVKLNKPTPFSLPADTTYCENPPLQLSIPAQPSFVDIQWSDGSRDSTIRINEPGQYWVEASVGDCRLRDTTDVRLPLLEWEGLPADTSLCEDETYLLDASLEGAGLYLWQDGSNEPVFEVIKPDRYLVKVVIDECTLTDSVTVRWCEPCVALPNAFTPNGDGINDFFAPITQCPIPDYQFRVFNRWGEQVFESNSPDIPWDGIHKGKPAPAEVYFYQLAYRPFSGEPVEMRRGDVVLLR